MLVAVLLIHGADPLAKQEPALQYLLVYVVLLFAGSGKFSIDYLLQGKMTRNNNNRKAVPDPTFAIYQ